MEKDKKNSYYDDVYEVKTSELWKYYNNESDDQSSEIKSPEKDNINSTSKKRRKTKRSASKPVNMDMERFKNTDLKQNYNFDYEIENKLLRDDYDTNANLFNKIPDKFNLKLICQDEPSGIVVGSSDLILKKINFNESIQTVPNQCNAHGEELYAYLIGNNYSSYTELKSENDHRKKNYIYSFGNSEETRYIQLKENSYKKIIDILDNEEYLSVDTSPDNLVKCFCTTPSKKIIFHNAENQFIDIKKIFDEITHKERIRNKIKNRINEYIFNNDRFEQFKIKNDTCRKADYSLYRIFNFFYKWKENSKIIKGEKFLIIILRRYFRRWKKISILDKFISLKSKKKISIRSCGIRKTSLVTEEDEQADGDNNELENITKKFVELSISPHKSNNNIKILAISPYNKDISNDINDDNCTENNEIRESSESSEGPNEDNEKQDNMSRQLLKSKSQKIIRENNVRIDKKFRSNKQAKVNLDRKISQKLLKKITKEEPMCGKNPIDSKPIDNKIMNNNINQIEEVDSVQVSPVKNMESGEQMSVITKNEDRHKIQEYMNDLLKNIAIKNHKRNLIKPISFRFYDGYPSKKQETETMNEYQISQMIEEKLLKFARDETSNCIDIRRSFLDIPYDYTYNNFQIIEPEKSVKISVDDIDKQNQFDQTSIYYHNFNTDITSKGLNIPNKDISSECAEFYESKYLKIHEADVDKKPNIFINPNYYLYSKDNEDLMFINDVKSSKIQIITQFTDLTQINNLNYKFTESKNIHKIKMASLRIIESYPNEITFISDSLSHKIQLSSDYEEDNFGFLTKKSFKIFDGDTSIRNVFTEDNAVSQSLEIPKSQFLVLNRSLNAKKPDLINNDNNQLMDYDEEMKINFPYDMQSKKIEINTNFYYYYDEEMKINFPYDNQSKKIEIKTKFYDFTEILEQLNYQSKYISDEKLKKIQIEALIFDKGLEHLIESNDDKKINLLVEEEPTNKIKLNEDSNSNIYDSIHQSVQINPDEISKNIPDQTDKVFKQLGNHVISSGEVMLDFLTGQKSNVIETTSKIIDNVHRIDFMSIEFNSAEKNKNVLLSTNNFIQDFGKIFATIREYKFSNNDLSNKDENHVIQQNSDEKCKSISSQRNIVDDELVRLANLKDNKKINFFKEENSKKIEINKDPNGSLINKIDQSISLKSDENSLKIISKDFVFQNNPSSTCKLNTSEVGKKFQIDITSNPIKECKINKIKIEDDKPIKNFEHHLKFIEVKAILPDFNNRFQESYPIGKFDINLGSDESIVKKFEIMQIYDDYQSKKLVDESNRSKELSTVLSRNQNLSFYDNYSIDRFHFPKDETNSLLLTYWETRNAKLKELEERIQTGNVITDQLNLKWNESDSDKEIHELDLTTGKLNDNSTHLWNLSLEKTMPDADISHLCDFLVNTPFEQLNVSDYFTKTFKFAQSALSPIFFGAKIVDAIAKLKDIYNKLRTNFKNRNNKMLLKQYFTQISLFTIDIYSEFIRTIDFIQTKNSQDRSHNEKFKRLIENNHKKIQLQTGRTIKLIGVTLSYNKSLNDKKSKVKNNINNYNTKHSLIQEKSKDIDNTIIILKEELNKTINSITKSKRYLNKIAFCDKLNSLVNEENFHTQNPAEKIQILTDFLNETNLISSLFCKRILNSYKSYIDNVSKKNLDQLKKMKEVKHNINNENKIKLRHVKSFTDTRKEEISSINTIIEKFKMKQIGFNREIDSPPKFSFAKFFSFTKVIMILIIILLSAMILREKYIKA